MRSARASHRAPSRGAAARPWIAGFAIAFVLLAGSGCKYVKDEFTFLDRAAPPQPPPTTGTDADR